MKRILSIFIVLLVLCLPITSFAVCGPAPTPSGDWIFPGSMCENILVVCDTSEYTTITEAMTAANAWDVIMVAPGTYNEAVTFTQNNLTLRAYGSAEDTIITQAAGTTVSFGTKYGCTVDGFTVSLSASTSTNDEVIFSNNNSATAYNTVKNCIIETENAGGSTFGLYGINVDDGNFALLFNRIEITQTNNHALYAIWNTAVHTSKYIGNTLTIDQQSTGAHMLNGFHHHAGAGSIMYCLENILTIDSTHTLAGIGYGIYASAEHNFVNDNIIDADASSTGVMYGLFTNAGKTAEYNGNTIDVTTGDSDGEWANFGAGTSYAYANTVTGDGVMGTGGTIYKGINLVNDAANAGEVNADELNVTGPTHLVLSAGKPLLIGGADIATLTGVTISNANPSVLTKDATIDDGLAVGDAVVVNSGTNATVSTYIVASIVVNTSVTLDRQAATGVCTDGNITYVNDVIIIEVASGSGKPRIVLPLQSDTATPTLAFGDGDSGFYERIADTINVSLGSIIKWEFSVNRLGSSSSTGATFRRETASATNPTIVPVDSDDDTGTGHAAVDQLSHIAGGVEAVRLSETTAKMVEKFACSALGGVGRVAFSATANITAAHTITIQVNIPSGAKILGVQMRVDVALAAGETWNAQYVTGATQTIASAQAVAVNTKVNKFFDENAATAIGSGETDITIQKNSNPGVDVFTAQGTIRAVVYYEDFTALADL